MLAQSRVILGLIGKSLVHSFSREYFALKFQKLQLNHYTYQNFELATINEVVPLLENSQLIGFNVTIPYKETILPYLDEIDETALELGAVNTVVRMVNDKWKGYNTDTIGFRNSLMDFYPNVSQNVDKLCAVLGTGGAAKAVHYVLKKLNREVNFVSRNPKREQISYENLRKYFSAYNLIVNCTPVGMGKLEHKQIEIPYHMVNKDFYCYDLIYNPQKTLFLLESERMHAHVQNGYKMLVGQAEAAWRIWQKAITKY